MSANLLVRAKRRRLAALAAVAARARDERVAMRMLDAPATRQAAGEAAGVRSAPALGTYGGDPMDRAFAAAVVRVREGNWKAASQGSHECAARATHF